MAARCPRALKQFDYTPAPVWVAIALLPLAAATCGHAAELAGPDRPPPIARRPAPPPTALTAAGPHVAIAGFEPAAQTPEHNAWLATAVEETLGWRLRRTPGIVAIPTVRTFQARKELQDEGQPPPTWPHIARLLGANVLVTGSCGGHADAVVLRIAIVQLAAGPRGQPPGDGSDAQPAPTGGAGAAENGTAAPVREEIDLPVGRLAEVLDAATNWVLARLGLTLPPAAARLVLAPPANSPSTLEYYAKGLHAARAGDLRNARLYVVQALGYDERYRPGLAMLAQLDLQAGPAGRESAALRLRALSELARRAGDHVDWAAAELGLGAAAHAGGAFEAAYLRYETCLALSYEYDSPYGQSAALNSLADLYLTMPPPPVPRAAAPAQAAEAAAATNATTAAAGAKSGDEASMARPVQSTSDAARADTTGAVLNTPPTAPTADAAAAAQAPTPDAPAAAQAPTPDAAAAAQAAFERGNLRWAARWQEAGLELLAQLGDLVAEPPAANKLALTYERLGESEQALELHRRTLAAAQRCGSRRNQATAWLYIAQSHQRRGEHDQALAAAAECLELAGTDMRPLARLALAGIHQTRNEPDAALEQFEQSYAELRTGGGELVNQLVCLREIAELRMKLGRRGPALAALQEAIDVAHALELPEEADLRARLAEWRK